MESIALTLGAARLTLHGPAAAAPFRGARLKVECGAGESLREPLDVLLEGSPAEITAAVEALGQFLSRAEADARQPGGDWGYLEVRPAAGVEIQRSQILRGWLEFPAGMDGATRGKLGLRLALERANWWEGERVSLPLSNSGGSRVTTGLKILNHCDSHPGHQNFVHIAGEDITGDLPAPVSVTINALNAAQTGEVWAGLNLESDPDNLNINLEGEDGAAGEVTGERVTYANASGEQFYRLQWSGSQAVFAWSTALIPAHLRQFQSRPFRPVLTLSGMLLEDIWAWLELEFEDLGAETVWRGQGQFLAKGTAHQDLPVIFLPPWYVGEGGTPPGLTLKLMCQAAGAGSHTLEIDHIQLMPLDGWRKYHPLLHTLHGVAITDDCARGVVSSGSWAVQTHKVEGPGFAIIPGRAARFFFLVNQGISQRADLESVVSIHYRPRRRAL